MAQIKAPRGTQDMLPAQAHKWQAVESTLLALAQNYGYTEIRTPVFESTELFQRGVGDTTDVVQKEMYTFEDKGGRSITLRPEGTAGAVRAAVEHSLLNDALPLKLCYLTSCYRYEKPQAGRLREFHQFGVECFGTKEPIADAQMIVFARRLFDCFSLSDIHLEINSIGCPHCRENYYAALREYFSAHKENLCRTCNDRLEKNPMRILDCKSPECQKIAADAPSILDYLCEECAAHFESVKGYLDSSDIPYTVNDRIVRGLDYYTKTVFEFICDAIGAQGTVLGGGRYDGLVEELGGKPVPALGFAMGLERLLLLLEAKGFAFAPPATPAIYFCTLGEKARALALNLCDELQQDGYGAALDLMGRSLKAQMKYANKLGAQFTAVIGDDDIAGGVLRVKNMQSGEAAEIALSDFTENFENLFLQQTILNDFGVEENG